MIYSHGSKEGGEAGKGGFMGILTRRLHVDVLILLNFYDFFYKLALSLKVDVLRSQREDLNMHSRFNEKLNSV